MVHKAFLIIAALSINSASSADLNPSTLQKMEELQSQYNLPSLSVAIGLGDEVIFAEAIGYADIGSAEEASAQTQYSVGSLAKPMTGIALAKLVDLGKANLEDRVSTYVKTPEYTKDFTVEELAAHIAGVPHDTPERDRAEFKNVRDHKSPLEAFYVFDKHPLLFDPGTEFKYSSNGYILLSAVIEAASDTGYVDFLKHSMWAEFEMKDTKLDTSFAGKDREATYYSALESDGKHLEATSHRDRSFLFGGGGFISTPSDLVKMSQATYDESYLSSDAKELLMTPVSLRSGEINSEKYSLGWRVGKIQVSKESKESWTALHHGGVTDNASNVYVLVIPECKASIAFATNFVPEKFWKMRGAMARILIGYIDEKDCAHPS